MNTIDYTKVYDYVMSSTVVNIKENERGGNLTTVQAAMMGYDMAIVFIDCHVNNHFDVKTRDSIKAWNLHKFKTRSRVIVYTEERETSDFSGLFGPCCVVYDDLEATQGLREVSKRPEGGRVLVFNTAQRCVYDESSLSTVPNLHTVENWIGMRDTLKGGENKKRKCCPWKCEIL